MFKVRNKLKLQVKMKFIVEQTMRAQKGSKVVALLFNLGARWRWVFSTTLLPLYHRKRQPIVPIIQKV
jgi:hypothetical protein